MFFLGGRKEGGGRVGEECVSSKIEVQDKSSWYCTFSKAWRDNLSAWLERGGSFFNTRVVAHVLNLEIPWKTASSSTGID